MGPRVHVKNQHPRKLISAEKMLHKQFEDVPLVEFVSLIFTRMSGNSYCRQLGFLLLCLEAILLVEFMYLLFTYMPGKNYCR